MKTLAMLLPVMIASMLAAYEGVPFMRARNAGVGNAVSASANGVTDNPASLGFCRGITLDVAYSTPYTEGDILFYAAEAVWGNAWSSFAAAYRSYSLPIFSECAFRGMHAFMPHADIAVGYAAQMDRVTIDDVSSDCVLLSAGALVRFGACTAGASVSSVRVAGNERYAEALSCSAGIAYALLTNAAMYADVFVCDSVPVFRAGFEMWFIDSIAVRAGTTSRPEFSAGCGVRLCGVSIDYAAVLHPSLGITHVLSAGWGMNVGGGVR